MSAAIRILIVDDEREIRDILRYRISILCNSKILEAETLGAAKEIVKVNQDHLIVICDYYLSDGTGADLHAFLKSKGLPFSFVIHSANNLQELHYFKKNPIDAMIEKPDFDNRLQKFLIQFFAERGPSPFIEA